MKSIGWLLVILGAGSFVLNLVGMEFRYLMWIDNWGTEIGWALRGALIVAGGVLLFLGMKSKGAAETPAAPASPAEPTPSVEPEPSQSQDFDPQLSTQSE